MQLVKNHEKTANYIFLAAVAIHLLVMCVECSSFSVPYRGRLLQAAFLLCCVKIVMTYYEQWEWLLMFLMAILGGAVYACCGEKYIIYVMVLIMAARGSDMRTVLKMAFGMSLVALLVIAILSLCGIGGVPFVTEDFGRGSVETRYSLGFSHANNLHGMVWYIMSLAILMWKDRLNRYWYLGMTVLNVLLYILTLSRAGVIACQLMIIAGLVYRYLNKVIFEAWWIYILGGVALAAIVILTLVSVKTDCFSGYGPVLSKLDSLLTGRLNLAYQSAYIGDWHLFSPGGSHKYPIDNGFAYLPAFYGYGTAIVFVIYNAFLIWKGAVRRDGIFFALVMTGIFYTFMESSFMLNDAYLMNNPVFIVTMLLLGENYGTEKHQA